MRALLNRADWAVLALALAAAPFLFQAAWSARGGTPVLEIYGPDGATQRLALDRDRTVRVAGPLGESVIEVHGGRARFTHSPCRAKVCVLSGWLHDPGAIAACVPNEVAVAVVADGQVIDAVNF